jgi:adenine-specific DNA-methyltransferase
LASAVASTLVRLARPGQSTAVAIMDPACGDGALLLSLAAVLRNSGVTAPISIIASDLDQHSVSRTASLLEEFGEVDARTQDFLAATADRYRESESLFSEQWAPYAVKPDILIANPPYVRTQVLGAERAQALASFYQLSGRVDLAYPFVMAMIDAIAEGGFFAIILSNKFLTIRAGESLRQFLQERTELLEIWDLGDSKLFGAAVLPAVIFGRKGAQFRPEQIRVRSIYSGGDELDDQSAKTLDDTGLLEDFSLTTRSRLVKWRGEKWTIRIGHLGVKHESKTWVLEDESTSRASTVMKRSGVRRWGELFQVSVGIKTTADNVFIRSDWDELPFEQLPEAELLWPIRLSNDAARWALAPDDSLRHRTLYPYMRNSERRVTVDLSKFPRAAAYLNEHAIQLKGRHYVINSGRSWYEPWVPHAPKRWLNPRLIWRDIAASPVFAVDESCAIPNGTLYWGVPRSPDTPTEFLWAAAAIANAKWAGNYYDLIVGTRLYAGRRRYNTQALNEFPMPSDDRHINALASLAHHAATATVTSDEKQLAVIESEIENYCEGIFGRV